MRNTQENSVRNSTAGFRDGFTYFLIGGGIGAVMALLFAPKSGSEFRGEIADVSRKGYEATREKAIGLKEQSSEVIQNAVGKAEKVYDLAASKFAKGERSVDEAASAAADSATNALNRLDALVDDGADPANKMGGGGSRASSVM